MTEQLLLRSLLLLLGDSLCLLCGRRSAEVVEVDVEPLVDLGVQRVVLVADLLRRQSLFQRLRLGRRAVLVSAAHVQ